MIRRPKFLVMPFSFNVIDSISVFREHLINAFQLPKITNNGVCPCQPYEAKITFRFVSTESLNISSTPITL